MNTLLKTTALPVILWVFLFEHHVSGQTFNVEWVVGASVILPCTLTPNGVQTWRQGPISILVKQADGEVIISTGPYNENVSLVNGDDLRINRLDRNRDGNTGQSDKIFVCEYTGGGGGRQQIQLRLLAKIAGVSFQEASNGRVTVTADTPKTLTCSVTSVTGDPKPLPSYYSWSVDDGPVSGQTSNTYTFTPNRSMKTIECTATNTYSNDSVLSKKEATVTLNVQYLDRAKSPAPIIKVNENDKATLQCSAEGNPPPSYRWLGPGNSEIKSTSVNYTIDNVHRSTAGEYTYKYKLTANLVVEYPPEVTVSYDKPTKTLTCSAEGVPGDYTYSQWEHRLDGKLLQTLGTKTKTRGPKGTTEFKLPGTLTYEDTGYYVCQVSNGIKSPQRGQVLVTPQSPPLFDVQSYVLMWTEGDSKNISAPFYTYSDTPGVKVVWEKSGESTVLTTHREETGPITLMIRGQSVSIEGTVTVLTLREVTRSDDGNYTLTVTNNINGVSQSNQITFSLFVTLLPTSSTVTITDTSPISVGDGQANKQPGVEVAPIAGGAAGAVVLILVIVILIIVVRRRSVNNKNTGHTPEEAIRPPEERIVAQFHNGPQEGGVYQDLTINPDYVDTTENQPYASLANVPQYEDVSFSAQGAIPEYIDVYPENTENTEYENTHKNTSTLYYNL